MKVNRFKLANALIDAGIDEGKARTLAREAYDAAEKDMASTGNVNRINAGNRTEMAKIGVDLHKATADMQAAITVRPFGSQLFWPPASGSSLQSVVSADHIAGAMAQRVTD